jgi:hypothetical protein
MTRLGIGDYEAVLAFLEEAHAVDGPPAPTNGVRGATES